MIFSVVASTGEILRCLTMPTRAAADMNTPAGAHLIDGHFDPAQFYVDPTNGPTEFPPRPDMAHVWDWSSREWIDPRTASEIEAEAWAALRAERDRLLLASGEYMWLDRPMPDDLRAAWIAYRQALRDLPETTVDPTNPIWPTPPKEA